MKSAVLMLSMVWGVCCAQVSADTSSTRLCSQRYESRPHAPPHIYLGIFANNQIHTQQYYHVAAVARPYVDQLDYHTQYNRLSWGYGLGLGYFDASWIVSLAAIRSCFEEKRRSLENNTFSVVNGYYYTSARFSIGHKVWSNPKYVVFPEFELGCNFYERTDGKLIDPSDFKVLAKADKGLVAQANKFRSRIGTLGLGLRVVRHLAKYSVFMEPYVTADVGNALKPNEPYRLKRRYMGWRMGLMFYFW